MGSRGRGGYQAPRHPAPASGPGAGSARTDGGAAQMPTLRAPDHKGLPYGQNKQLNDQAAAAPPPAQGPPSGVQPSAAPAPMLDPFRPTERPWEPVNAGASYDQTDDARALIAALYEQTGNDDLRDLLEHL